ncbi:DciA family protein [Psychromonas aquatilis]|uniref:DciA family protein n=1 Tax=Psychromonas aquatilis TaxID=2005072 RepID=A0ABU9GQ25_9GAMM
MTTHKKQPKPIASLLEKNNYQQSTSLISKMDIILQRVLKQHNIKGSRIGNIENGRVIIESPTAAWSQRLNFIRNDLLSELRQHHSSLTSIKFIVNPKLAKLSPDKIKKSKPVKIRAERMSKDVAASFLALADNADPELKKALQSLAKYSSDKN